MSLVNSISKAIQNSSVGEVVRINVTPEKKALPNCTIRAVVAITGEDYPKWLHIFTNVNRIADKKFTKYSWPKNSSNPEDRGVNGCGEIEFFQDHPDFVLVDIDGEEIQTNKKIWEMGSEGTVSSQVYAKTLAKRLRKGRYMLNTVAHSIALIDGRIIDTWDSSRKKIRNIWKYVGPVKDDTPHELLEATVITPQPKKKRNKLDYETFVPFMNELIRRGEYTRKEIIESVYYYTGGQVPKGAITSIISCAKSKNAYQFSRNKLAGRVSVDDYDNTLFFEGDTYA